MKESRLRHLSGAVLLLFIFYIGGNTLFTHTHRVDDTVVAHSHPYLPGAQHSHTTGQLMALAQASLAQMSGMTEPAAMLAAPSTSFISAYVCDKADTADTSICLSLLRAPPVAVLS